MPWNDFKLYDGTVVPGIAFGTGSQGLGEGDSVINCVEQAISVGFRHIDTAQMYLNEEEAGKAIKNSGLPRSDIYITTKFSGVDGKSIAQSVQESLQKLGVSYVDLYLIHNPQFVIDDIPGGWKQMEEVKEKGFAKNIGVSNFNIPRLEIVLASAKIKPAVNQIGFHPGLLTRFLPIHEFNQKNGIVTQGFSPLTPVAEEPGGPIEDAVTPIAVRLNATKDQVLLAWAKAKGILVVTSSSKKSRLEGYLKAGDLELSNADIRDIDVAGAIEV